MYEFVKTHNPRIDITNINVQLCTVLLHKSDVYGPGFYSSQVKVMEKSGKIAKGL